MARLAQDYITLMVPEVLKGRLQDFLYDCVASAPTEQADRIREARRLLGQAMWQTGGGINILPGERTLEMMLAAGAYESAVLALLGPEPGFMLSRGSNGICLATMAPSDDEDEVTAEGSTPALALLAAMVSVMLAVPD